MPWRPHQLPRPGLALAPPQHSNLRPKEGPETPPGPLGSERITLSGPVVEMQDGHMALVKPKAAHLPTCPPFRILWPHRKGLQTLTLDLFLLTSRKWEWKEPRLEAQGPNAQKASEKSPRCVLGGLGRGGCLLTLTASCGCSEPRAQSVPAHFGDCRTTSQF